MPSWILPINKRNAKEKITERKFNGYIRNLFAHIRQAVDIRKLPAQDSEREGMGIFRFGSNTTGLPPLRERLRRVAAFLPAPDRY